MFLVDKDETGLEKIGSIVNNMIMFNYEIELHCFVCDLSKEKEVDDMLEQVKEKLNFKQLDILINNAGIMFGEKINNFSLEQFKKTFEINIFSQVRLVKYLLPSLISSKGSIVSINSIMSQLPSAYLSDYCSSKSANFMFYECLRQEVGNKIHILSVLPYAINTNLFGKGFVIDSSSSFLEKMRNFMFPLLDKTEVAEQIIFAIETKQSYLYIYQSLGYLVFIMRLFPVKLYDFCLSLGCTEQSMIKIKSRV